MFYSTKLRRFMVVSHGFAVVSHGFAVVSRWFRGGFAGGFAGFAGGYTEFRVVSPLCNRVADLLRLGFQCVVSVLERRVYVSVSAARVVSHLWERA